jgi:hypothetical protein
MRFPVSGWAALSIVGDGVAIKPDLVARTGANPKEILIIQ